MEEVNLNGQSHDIVKENVAKLKQLFPEIVTEDNIDFDKLKAVLGEYIEKDDESYRFTWYGKRDALKKSQIPSTGTLRPCIEDSKDWDTTQNLYIEGDNLEVLKLLQKSYNNKIKMIYIDPPYNKDKDFIYPDKWSDPVKEYKKITGQVNEEGNINNSETEEEGGRHTKWLNMMYPRLRLAKNLLTDDGVIFISIDDNEVSNLKKICDEIFGENNLIKELIVNTSEGGGQAKYVINGHEYLLIYAKDILQFDNLKKPKDIRGKKISIDNELYWIQEDAVRKEFGKYGNLHYEEILEYKNQDFKDKIDEGICNNEYILIKKSYGMHIIGKLRKISEDFSKFHSIIKLDEISKNLTKDGIKELEDIFQSTKGNSPFDNPKPVELIKTIIHSMTFNSKNDIVLDFFSGSSTTAQAIFELNSLDIGKRRFIMVQLPEEVKKEDSNIAYNYIKDILIKPTNICEIGKERIRRSGDKMKSELKEKYDAYHQKQQSITESAEEAPMNPDDLDIGFKVFKLDNTNLKKWAVDVGDDFYKESKEMQNAILSEKLGLEVDNFVEGRSELDVVYEIMLKYGLDLTYPIETYNFNGKNIYSIGYGGLIVCLDTDINTELADKIVALVEELEPSMVRVAVRDLSFKTDSDKTNFKETLKNGVCAYFDKNDNKTDKQNQFKFITI